MGAIQKQKRYGGMYKNDHQLCLSQRQRITALPCADDDDDYGKDFMVGYYRKVEEEMRDFVNLYHLDHVRLPSRPSLSLSL